MHMWISAQPCHLRDFHAHANPNVVRCEDFSTSIMALKNLVRS